MKYGRVQARALAQIVITQPEVRARWFRILSLGAAVCLLAACSSPQKSHNSLTLGDLWATANVERVDGGVTYVNRTFPVTGLYYGYGSVYRRYPPHWLGGFRPYYALYYPYYGYRPRYVWDCPVARPPSHPGPVILAGQPTFNPGLASPINPVSAPPSVNAMPLADSNFVALEPGYRYRVSEPYLSGTVANPGLLSGQPPNLTSQLGRPTESTNGAMAGLNARPGGNDTLRTLQRPEPVRYSGSGSQRYSSGRASNSRPTRSISRSPRASISRSVNVSSSRSEAQR